MKRRDFLKAAAISSAALSIPAGISKLISAVEAASYPDLVVSTGSSPAKITRAAVNALGGMQRFISKGNTVAIKPNIGWDRTPEYAANTNPEVVAEVVRMCYESGAKKVMVFDRPVNDPRRCYVQSGISDAAKSAGAEIVFVDERKFRDVKINGEAIKSWPLYEPLLAADKIINIPIAKHHGLSRLTMAMKNWMGVMGGRRSHIHQRLDESLVDLCLVIKPTLTILDAVRILVANGPQGGSLDDVKKLDTIVAGVDQVAVDAYGATLFGMKGNDLGYVRMAAQRGLGKMDLQKLNIKKITV
ncbi:MAG: DUF362 domain-containing protein [Nitrospirae bacterium]|nr:DUF362 domain-containing protein [Nitrospirota bacterium]